MITRQQIRKLCEKNGGQTVVAPRIKRTKDHLNKVISGKYPVTEKLEKMIRATFPDFKI